MPLVRPPAGATPIAGYGAGTVFLVEAADNPSRYFAKPTDATILVDLSGYVGPGPLVVLTTPLDDYPILVRSIKGSGALHPWGVSSILPGLEVEDPAAPGTFSALVTFNTDFAGATWTFDRVRTRWVLSVAVSAVAAGGGNEQAIALPFSFSSGSPLAVAPLPPGATVSRAALRIDTAFDGAGAALELGTPFSPALLLAPGDNVPSRVGQYESDAIASFPIADALQLRITPGGGATAGAGVVFVNLNS